MASKGCKKSAVLIKWKTQDRWFDKEQTTPRDTIDPADGPLEKGQWVKVKFNRRWSPAEVCEEWTGQKNMEQSKLVELG